MSLNTISPSVLNLYIINEEIVKLVNRSITLVTKKDNNKKYIMIKYSNLTDIEKNEIRMFISLPKNESLVQCYNIIFSLYDNMYYCFIDYANKMTLHHFIVDKKQNEYIDEGIIWKFLIQMLYAIYPLHSNKIIHRNIKNSNFFLYDDYTIKLGGFKLCEYNNEKNSLSNFASSLNYFYASPEMINKESYDYNSDIWSIGMCIYEMCFPQNEFNQLDMYLNALQGKIKEINLKIYSQELFDVICLMMRNNKVSRPSCEKMLSNQIILSHVYDPMKYLDVLSCGKGYIEKIQKLNEIDDFNYYVNEYVSSHFDNENSIENNTSTSIFDTKKAFNKHRTAHFVNNISQSDSFEHTEYLNSKIYPHKNSFKRDAKSINKSKSVSCKYSKKRAKTPTDLEISSQIKMSKKNSSKKNTSCEADYLVRKLAKNIKIKNKMNMNDINSDDNVIIRQHYNSNNINTNLNMKKILSNNKNRTLREDVKIKKIIDSSKLNRLNISSRKTLIDHLVTPMNKVNKNSIQFYSCYSENMI